MERHSPRQIYTALTLCSVALHFNFRLIDAYEVHKKIQEAIMAVEVYKLKAAHSPMWHPEIINGLEELGKLRQTLDRSANSAGQTKISKV